MAVRPIDANAMLTELRPVSFESEHSAVLLSDVSKMMREWVERQPTLTPVSLGQVEKVWRGCDFCKKEMDDYPYIVAHSDYSSSDTCYEPSFCPICGKPLTDEAVEITMRRLEAMKYGKGD